VADAKRGQGLQSGQRPQSRRRSRDGFERAVSPCVEERDQRGRVRQVWAPDYLMVWHGRVMMGWDGQGAVCASRQCATFCEGVGAGTGRVCLTGLGLLMSSTRLADDADRRGRFFTTKDEALRCWQMQGGRPSRSDTADPSERPRARSARSRGEPRGNRREGKGRMMGGWGRALHARCRPGREKGREAEAAEGIPAPFAGPAG
jgi:hypothetical protein